MQDSNLRLVAAQSPLRLLVPMSERNSANDRWKHSGRYKISAFALSSVISNVVEKSLTIFDCGTRYLGTGYEAIKNHQ